jgi:YVTN family beta-propeller protein
MNFMHKLCLAISLGVLVALFAQAAPQTLHEIARFKLGGDGGWDLLALDESGERLFVARGNRVMVVNTATGALTGEIPGVEGAHAVAIAPKQNLGFVTAGKLGEVWAFNLKTLNVEAKITAGQNPDAILFDPATERVFAFNGKSNDVSVIDSKTKKVVGTITVGGKPELGVSDGAGKIYLNVEDKNALLVIDAKKMTVLNTFPLAPCEEPTGIAMDTNSHRLFIGCGGNGMAATVDARTGKVLQALHVGEGIDGAGFDPSRKLAFFPAGKDGKLIVLHETKSGFEPAQEIFTQKSARTLALDQKSGRAYLPAAEFGKAPPAEEGKEPKRPPVLPGTFTVLVIGR